METSKKKLHLSIRDVFSNKKKPSFIIIKLFFEQIFLKILKLRIMSCIMKILQKITYNTRNHLEILKNDVKKKNQKIHF